MYGAVIKNHPLSLSIYRHPSLVHDAFLGALLTVMIPDKNPSFMRPQSDESDESIVKTLLRGRNASLPFLNPSRSSGEDPRSHNVICRRGKSRFGEKRWKKLARNEVHEEERRWRSISYISVSLLSGAACLCLCGPDGEDRSSSFTFGIVIEFSNSFCVTKMFAIFPLRMRRTDAES